MRINILFCQIVDAFLFLANRDFLVMVIEKKLAQVGIQEIF